ncbi:hypothetical protein AAIA71_28525 (plasmid) [Vibrio harveyi]|uniref:hypothetical protein n=1 Tax=Vibrio harveyi TaxID=669 RepID=UPI0024815DF1|nr:hypothetical protein [Vibrio harveyi]
MKHTSACAIAMLITCLPLTAVGGLTIDRNSKTIGSTKDYDDIRDGLNIKYSYQNHDDSVGTRGNNNSLNGNVIVDSNSGNASNTLAPIDCSHVAYKPLCDELKDYADNAMTDVTPPEPEVKYVWKQVIYAYTQDLNYLIPSEVKKIKFKLSNQDEVQFDLPNTGSWQMTDWDSNRRGGRNDCYVRASATGSARLTNSHLTVQGEYKTESGCGVVVAKTGIEKLLVYAPQ